MLRGNRRRQPQQLKAPGFAIEVRARLLHIHYSYDVIVKDSSRTTLTCAAAAARDGLLPVCQVPVVWWPQLQSHNTQQHMVVVHGQGMDTDHGEFLTDPGV